MFDLTNVSNIVVGSVVSIGAYILAHKAGIISFIRKEAPVVAQVAQSVASLPGAKLVEVELHQKLNDTEAKFRDSELGRLAAVALNYTAKDLHELSDVQLNALAIKISTQVPKEWNVSEAQIVEALRLAQKASDAIAADPVVVAADAFTEQKAQAVQQRQVDTIGEQTQQTPA